MIYLSKSDFKVAQSCATKLYYKKQKYPSQKDNNDYLALLADGGFMIGKLAQLLYPEGIEIEETRENQHIAIKRTDKLLAENENIILFEPAIYINNQLIRIDILVKKGNELQLIEVKSKSYDSNELLKTNDGDENNPAYWLKNEFRPYLEDTAFQKKVLMEKYPHAKIKAYLLMPDKSKVNTHEGLIKWFVLAKKDKQTTVDFIGTDEDLKKLRSSNFMGLECVDIAIDKIKDEISSKAEIYIESLLLNKKVDTEISFKCRDCEYRTDTDKSGFKECWGKLAEPKPHILELGQLGNVNKKDNIINDLISNGKSSLSDVPIESVLRESSPFYNDRPFFQLACKEEFILDGFSDALSNLEYPLHFIDFETCQMAVPFHAGMKPFENVIFQWSCHKLNKDGTIEHFEWLNADDYYPNIEFARTLRDCVGSKGTLLTWSSYENTQLKAIHDTLEETPEVDEDLINWISNILFDKTKENNRILDMHQLALKYYFHPKMGGRTSIKVVLPSVLNATNSNKITDWLKQIHLYAENSASEIVDPYKLLESKIIEDTLDLEVKVRNGGDAMVAYREMLYGLTRNQQNIKETYSKALKNYCKLDTLAMLIIWEHWQDLLESKEKIKSREQIISIRN